MMNTKTTMTYDQAQAISATLVDAIVDRQVTKYGETDRDAKMMALGYIQSMLGQAIENFPEFAEYVDFRIKAIAESVKE